MDCAVRRNNYEWFRVASKARRCIRRVFVLVSAEIAMAVRWDVQVLRASVDAMASLDLRGWCDV